MDDDKKREYLITEIKKYNEKQASELERGWFINFLVIFFLIINNISFKDASEEVKSISQQIFKDISFFGFITLFPEGIVNFIGAIINSIKQMKLELELDKIDKEKIKIKRK